MSNVIRFLAHTEPHPGMDVALEEAIQSCHEEGLVPDTWRIWQPRSAAVIMGTGQEAEKEVQLAPAETEGVPVYRRHSGGGTVLIGPGTLHFSAFYRYANLPGSDSIKGAMSAALQPVIDLFKSWGLTPAETDWTDVALHSKDGTLRKIVGNAQARKRHGTLLHGTVLASPDWQQMERVLPFPQKYPQYRSGRGHRDFLTSLRDESAPFSIEEFGAGLCARLGADMVLSSAPTDEERERAERLWREKYGTREWNFRR